MMWSVRIEGGKRVLWCQVGGYWHPVTSQPHLVAAAVRLMS